MNADELLKVAILIGCGSLGELEVINKYKY